jgi:MSHA biogenesis protein MshI
MAWFRRSKHRGEFAVVSPMSGGAGALRLQGDAARPGVAAFAWRSGTVCDAHALSQLAHEIGARDARLIALLDTEHYQTVMVDAPAVPEEELRGALRWKVKDLINFHIDDAVMDHLPVPTAAGRPPALYVVAAQSAAVRELTRPYHQSGLQLEVIEVRETAQHNLAARLAPAEYAIAVLHLEGDLGLLTFSYGDDLILSRRIEGRGASGDSLFDKVAMEVQRSVDYFERQYSWFPLAKLYLAPMPAAEGLRAKLAEYLPVGIEVMDLNGLLDLSAVPPLHDPAQQNAAFHLLGAALRGAA